MEPNVLYVTDMLDSSEKGFRFDSTNKRDAKWYVTDSASRGRERRESTNDRNRERKSRVTIVIER